jgi:uncharacterized protein (DUF1330 family)
MRKGYVISPVDVANPEVYARYAAAATKAIADHARALREGAAEIEMVLVEGV